MVWQYADDVALVASSEAELRLLMDRLSLYCHSRGLTINYSKSKIMEISSDPFLPNKSFSFQPAGQALQKTVEVVEEFSSIDMYKKTVDFRNAKGS